MSPVQLACLVSHPGPYYCRPTHIMVMALSIASHAVKLTDVFLSRSVHSILLHCQLSENRNGEPLIIFIHTELGMPRVP